MYVCVLRTLYLQEGVVVHWWFDARSLALHESSRMLYRSHSYPLMAISNAYLVPCSFRYHMLTAAGSDVFFLIALIAGVREPPGSVGEKGPLSQQTAPRPQGSALSAIELKTRK